MNSELKERIINIWADNINYDQPLSEYDKETILYAILDDLVPDDFKYELYLEKIKEEADRVLYAFEVWRKTSKNANMVEYKKFYMELKKTFKYQLYKDIYKFFHPIVINNNFIIETPDTDNLPEHRIVASDEFVSNTFFNYMNYHALTKEEFINKEINFKEGYILENEYELKFEQYFTPSGVSKFNININNPYMCSNNYRLYKPF